MAKKEQNGAASGPMKPWEMEKMMQDLTKMLEEQDFESIEEANAFLSQFIGKKIPSLGPGDDPLSRAQELVYEAYDASSLAAAIKKAKQALKISPDCVDAYVLLGDLSESFDKAIDYYKQGVEAGRRMLGPEIFEEEAGHFWGMIETRPFMRAMASLAEALWMADEHDEALDIYRELLRLNPNDNQGMRYVLADCLMEDELHDELAGLFEAYEDDIAANWSYNRALMLFRTDGAGSGANDALHKAFEVNSFIPDYLTGKKKMPEELPDYRGFGDETEAVEYGLAGIPNWRNTYGAIRWLKKEYADFEANRKN